jgi:hypothetical protein
MSEGSTEKNATHPHLGPIPLLTDRLQPDSFPTALQLALDARMAEKQALLDLSGVLIQNLRPELDRMTAQLVQQTLQELWRKRSESYKNRPL